MAGSAMRATTDEMGDLVRWAEEVAYRHSRHPAWGQARDDLAGEVLLLAAEMLGKGHGRVPADLDELRASVYRLAGFRVTDAKAKALRHGFTRVGRGARVPRPASLDAPIDGDDARALASTVAAPGRSSSPAWSTLRTDRHVVREAVRSLPDPHRALISFRFGLLSHWGSCGSREALARRNGWDLARVERVEAEALAMLRRRFVGRDAGRKGSADDAFLAAAAALAAETGRPPSVRALAARLGVNVTSAQRRRDRLVREGRYPHAVAPPRFQPGNPHAAEGGKAGRRRPRNAS